MTALADTPWANTTLIAIDAESTGPNPLGAAIVSWARWTIHLGTGDKQVRTWLIDPGHPIPAEATAIHGITTDHARAHGQPPATALAEIARDLLHHVGRGGVAVGFNARFDLTLLRAECARHELEGLVEALATPEPVADPYVLDHHLNPARDGSRSLVATAAHYGITLAEPHRADADALAAAWLLHRQLTDHPKLAQLTPAELHRRQKTWFALLQSARQARAARTSAPTGRDYTPAWPIQRTGASA